MTPEAMVAIAVAITTTASLIAVIVRERQFKERRRIERARREEVARTFKAAEE